MYPYSPQLSFANGLSQSLFRTVQQYSELNIHLFQTLLEAAAKAGQPFVDALRVYQQHLSRIAADTHHAQRRWRRTERHLQDRRERHARLRSFAGKRPRRCVRGFDRGRLVHPVERPGQRQRHLRSPC